jgi:hypothetical protein
MPEHLLNSDGGWRAVAAWTAIMSAAWFLLYGLVVSVLL